MNGNLRRKAALALCLILTLALLSNLGVSAEAEPAKITLSGYEFSTEPVMLTAYVDWPNSFGAWGEDMVSKWITDSYGVSVDITWATTATSEELNLMMASGDPLPDFVIAQTGSAVARTLVREGFVEPLDELAKEYCPAFLALLPDEMYEIYQEPDGHLYHTVDWFADTKRLQTLIEARGELVQISGGNQTLMLNRGYYEALGSPKVDTLEELKAYLKLAYETYPDIRMPFVLANTTWNDSQDAVNYFYRLHGGQEWLYPDETGAIKLCLDDPAYKLALKDLNDLYQDGIINKETLTITNDTLTTVLSDSATFAFCGQDYNWFSKVPGGDQQSGPILPIIAPMAEGLTREKDLTLKFGDIASPGGTTAVFISVDSPNKARAIEYMALKFTDEAQTAERYGIEGVTYEYKDDGTIRWTKEYNDYLAEYGWVDMSKKYGPNNQVHAWFCTNYICKLESPESDYWVRKYNGQLHRPYMVSERILDLTKVIKDDNIKLIYDQFLMHVKEAVIRCIQADTDEAFEAEFEHYVGAARTMGQETLEAYFTENYRGWLEKGLGA